MENFPIEGLDFNQIKENFISFIKSDPSAPFTDFDFEGSGINAFINILAYNTHYLGYYVKMLLNESFIDSAIKRESLMSRAKLNAYVPGCVKTAKAKIKMSITLDEGQEPAEGYITLPFGYNFLGSNYIEDYRKFYLLEPIQTVEVEELYRYNSNTLKSFKYTTPEFIIHEGELRFFRYKVDENNLSQQFIIRDKNIDLSTLKVYIHPNIDTADREEFLLATELLELSKERKVYFITTTADGYFEIFFGNDIFGEKPKTDNIVSISYLASAAEVGNGCFAFSEPGRISHGDMFLYFNREDYNITVIENSNGGLSEESTEDMRFNIPNHFKRQNRMVTEQDYKTLLLGKFRNIDSINVWGGEKHFFKDYGSIYICIKPRTGLFLTETAKLEIEQYLKNYAVIGMQIKIIQPDYVWVDVSYKIKYDQTLTSLTKNHIENIITNETNIFNSYHLDRFNIGLSDVEMLDFVKLDKPYIKRIFNTKRLFKKFTFVPNTTTEHLIIFGNSLTQGSIYSSTLTFDKTPAYIIDVDGEMFLVNSDGYKIFNKSIGTIDYTLGIIKLIIDFNLDISSNIDENINLFATPVYPDIDSYLNNIVKINQIEVSFN